MSVAAGNSWIEIERVGAPVQVVELGDRPLRIGRAQDSDVLVPDAHVSKQHAELRPENGAWSVLDLGSRAGVLVNGKQMTRTALADGDVVLLGPSSPVRIVFHAPRPAREASLEATAVFETSVMDSRMTRLARFFEFSRKLGSGLSLAEVLRDVADLAIEITNAERGMVILLDGDQLRAEAARRSGARDIDPATVRISETLVRQTIAQGTPRIVQDVAEDIDLAQAMSIVALELRSAVILPLVRFQNGEAAGEVFGVLYLDSKRSRSGLEGFDLDILGRLAQDASAVVENARLMREAEQRRRIERELETAREVQSALLPERFVSTARFDVAGTCVPCHELGGDYIDQFELGGGRQILVVADVCGKGIAASLLAASLQGAIAAESGAGRPLAELVARVNRVHCRLAPMGRFVTMMAVLLEADGNARFVHAGHCPALHVHRAGVDVLPSNGMALGLDDGAEYEEQVVRMQPGDALVLYSDGVLECESPSRELFGQDRLVAALTTRHAQTAEAVLAAVTDRVAEFQGAAPASDDLSVLVAVRKS